MYMAILLCTNACMYKRINKKKSATFLMKKGQKSSVLYFILFWIIFVCSVVFFSTVKRKGNFDYIIIYLLTLYSAMLMFFVAYGKLCVSVTCVSVSTYFIKPGISERAILSCTLYPDPSFFCLKTDPCVCVRVYVCKCRWPCLLM